MRPSIGEDQRKLCLSYYDERGWQQWSREVDFRDPLAQEEFRWRSIVESRWIFAYSAEGKAKGCPKGKGKDKKGKGDDDDKGKGDDKGKPQVKGKQPRTNPFNQYSRRIWRQIVRESFEPYRRCEDASILQTNANLFMLL